MNDSAKYALKLAQNIRQEVPQFNLPPAEGTKPIGEMVIANSLTCKTRGYIEKVGYQINGCYEKGWYDACAVMIRRLIETLIIEVFEYHGISNKIKDPTSGDFFFLRDLINLALSETSWNLSRNTKQSLPKLKDIGDLSAHSRRYNAHRSDIDKIIDPLRIITQELIYLAGLK